MKTPTKRRQFTTSTHVDKPWNNYAWSCSYSSTVSFCSCVSVCVCLCTSLLIIKIPKRFSIDPTRRGGPAQRPGQCPIPFALVRLRTCHNLFSKETIYTAVRAQSIILGLPAWLGQVICSDFMRKIPRTERKIVVVGVEKCKLLAEVKTLKAGQHSAFFTLHSGPLFADCL